MPTGLDASERPGLCLGHVGGVPVYLSMSWFVIAAILVLTFGPGVRASMPHLGAGGAYLVAFAYALLLAVSVLCHEAAHAVVARRCGYVVERVVVNLWGGHTAFSTPAPSPGRSALVSISGPIANALLALAGWVLLGTVGYGVPWLLVSAWTLSNAFVAVFNLLPGLPLDGGYLVDALVWRVTGRRSAGMIAAGWGGRIVTLGALFFFVVLPFLQGGGVSLWSVAWFAFIGAFLWSGASSAIAGGRSLRALEAVPLAAVARPTASVPLTAPAAQIPGRVAAVDGALPVLVDEQGRAAGLVDPVAWQRLTEQHAEAAASPYAVPAAAVLLAQPAGWLAPYATAPGASVVDYLARLVDNPYGVVVLTDDHGRPMAALTSADVERVAAGEGAGAGSAAT